MALKGMQIRRPLTAPGPSSATRGSVSMIEPRYGGPERIKYDAETLARLIACGHRQFGLSVTAAWFGTTAVVLSGFFREHPDAKEAWQTAQHQGKGMLLGAQWDAARAGDARMLEWLGKQHLGQRDKIETIGDTTVRPTGAKSKLLDAIDAEFEHITVERSKTSAPQGGQSGQVPKGARRLQ